MCPSTSGTTRSNLEERNHRGFQLRRSAVGLICLIGLVLCFIGTRPPTTVARNGVPGPGTVKTQPVPGDETRISSGQEEEEEQSERSAEDERDDPPPPSTVDVEDVPETLRGHDRYYRVDYVFDGDSFALSTDLEVRLIGVDAPEKERAFAENARKTLRDLLPENTIVALDVDRQKRDRFNRLLAYVYTVQDDPDRQDPTVVFVNRALVRKGLARVYLHPKNVARKKTLIRAQRHAIEQERHLFRTLEETEDVYYGIQNHYRYHRPGCRFIRDVPDAYRVPFDTKKAALKSGRSPGSSCSP